jgi:hypothetical protein
MIYSFIIIYQYLITIVFKKSPFLITIIIDHHYYWSPLLLITITIDHHICHQIYHQHLQFDHDYLSSTFRVFHNKIPLFIIIYHHASRVMICNFIIVSYHLSTFDPHYYHRIANHHIIDHHWSLTILSHHIILLYIIDHHIITILNIIDHHKIPLLSSFKSRPDCRSRYVEDWNPPSCPWNPGWGRLGTACDKGVVVGIFLKPWLEWIHNGYIVGIL